MYNRYIPEDTSYTPIRPPAEGGRSPGNGPNRQMRFPDFLSGKVGKEGLSSLLKAFRLDKLDSGDVLLLLIMLYLLVEGDDMELVIALGLTLLMGLGENREE